MIIFIDVDGTLVDKDETVTPAVALACRQAVDAGHLVYLSTGRTSPEVVHIREAVGAHGVIGGGGSYVEMGHDVVHETALDADVTTSILDFMSGRGIPHYSQTHDALFGDARLISEFAQRRDAAVADGHDPQFYADHLAWLTPMAHLPLESAYKVGFHHTPDVTVDDVRRAFGDVTDVIGFALSPWGPHSGELLQPGVNKGTAVLWLLDRLGLDPSDALAFGDSANDLEMLQVVGTGIAMGNSSADALAVADEVTEPVWEDGVSRALVRHGLTGA